ncbi:hypothetical protein PIB30_075762 [Stylosanthes scabra]|uniref:Disease resistance protein At4g27190-like leucine-rich repeats domain-containing protein n=1 Tax=Stylosanthes scabra TaxID=79078 RepID=A0ABU6RR93_9FABA|nr:hypothetical protein [Stylosanthes scabra]
MKSLAILDLSQNHSLTSLPDSLSDLTCLVSLVLRYCLELKHVPTLEGLQKLSMLVISGTSVEVIPGLEMLTNLRWLDLSHNEELRFESRSLLRGLTNLQYLVLFNATLLTNLQYEYCLLMQIAESEWVLEAYDGIDPSGEDYQFLHLLDCEESPHLLPKDLTNLCIEYNTCWKSLCDALSDNTPSSLMNIKIEGCIKSPQLSILAASLFGELKSNFNTASLTSAIFSNLTCFEIFGCHEIEMLMTAGLLSQLQNLQTLIVNSCDSLREIFAASSANGDADIDDGASTIKLRSLSTLKLNDLPRLKSVCKGIISCVSLPKLETTGCPNLERRYPFQESSS